MSRARFELVTTDDGYLGRLIADSSTWSTPTLPSEQAVERAILALRNAVDAGARVRLVDARTGQPAVWTDEPDQA